MDKELRILKQRAVASTTLSGLTSLVCLLRMVLDVKINQAVCHLEVLVMYQVTGSSSGTERLLVNQLAIKHNMTSMQEMITKDACAISMVKVLLIVLKPMAHLSRQLRPLLLFQMRATTTKVEMKVLMIKVAGMMSLLLHRLIPGRLGKHLRKSAMNLTTTEKIATHVQCT